MKRFLVLISVVALWSLAFAPSALADAPGNDTYAGRSLVGSLSFSDSVDTTEATTDADDDEMNADCQFASVEASVWYEFTAPADESIMIETSGSSYVAGVIVAIGSPGSFSTVACGASGGGIQLAAIGGPLIFPASSGETYTILAVDLEGLGGGTLEITIDVAPPAPTIDVTVDPTGTFNKQTGSATISGTVTCTGDVQFAFIEVQLTQSVGRFTISGFGSAEGFACDGTAQPWSAEVFGQSGLFKGGRATALTFAVACDSLQCGFDEDQTVVRLR
jgi:hypothetical protein